MTQYYDIIGDIHGHADQLESLLQKLSYKAKDGIYQHPNHKVIFLGDFIDRGPEQRAVIDIVKPMIEQGFALSVMGNHEFNSICYASTDHSGEPLREHSEKNTAQHIAFLEAYPEREERQRVINWFRTLPVYLELDGLRVIHAFWNEQCLGQLVGMIDEDQCLYSHAYVECSKKDSVAYLAIETLLKGPEVPLPDGVSFKDSDGNERTQARFKWWVPNDKSPKERLHIGKNATNEHKITEMNFDDSLQYDLSHPPLFVGHYWLNHEQPNPLSDNIACVDYSVAKNGKLVAYCWRGEEKLIVDNFIW